MLLLIDYYKISKFGHLQLSQGNTSQFATLFSFLKFLLGFAVLSQVKGCNFFSLLNLGLVCLDLLSKLVSQVRHTILVLMIFFLLELQLLDTTLSPLEGLVTVSSASLDRSKLQFKFANLHFQFSHGTLASLSSSGFSIGQTVFKFTQLGVKAPLGTRFSLNMVLLSSQLIGKPCSINHSPLRFIF